ncbi:MAG TPA: hypothetical protein VL689_20910 [Paraburkholderia sp.]|nr:hypothetical protein [Paraburkholderia sp.]
MRDGDRLTSCAVVTTAADCVVRRTGRRMSGGNGVRRAMRRVRNDHRLMPNVCATATTNRVMRRALRRVRDAGRLMPNVCAPATTNCMTGRALRRLRNARRPMPNVCATARIDRVMRRDFQRPRNSRMTSSGPTPARA